MAAKRIDYFEAGTQVVWDVDPRARLHPVVPSRCAPTSPSFITKGQVASAEPALPGWQMAVADIFA